MYMIYTALNERIKLFLSGGETIVPPPYPHIRGETPTDTIPIYLVLNVAAIWGPGILPDMGGKGGTVVLPCK
jgi:hypothetical protein